MTLPVEVLLEILDALDPGEMTSWLYEEPHGCMLGEVDPDCTMAGCTGRSASSWLKSASRVCKRWRAILLPKLFRELVWMPSMSAGDLAHPELRLLVNFLTGNDLCASVSTITIAFPRSFDDAVTAYRHQMRLEASVRAAVDMLCSQLLSNVAPTRLTVVGSFDVLSGLLGCTEHGDGRFGNPYQVLSLARQKTRKAVLETSCSPAGITQTTISGHQDSQEVVSATFPDRSYTSELISRSENSPFTRLLQADINHQWTSVLFNEGSFIPVYRAYDFFQQTPPSILTALLAAIGPSGSKPSSLPLQAIFAIDYISIFPLTSHVKTLLTQIPTQVERLFLQLVPSSTNQVLKLDNTFMRHVSRPDLWLQRDDAYREILRWIISGSHVLFRSSQPPASPSSPPLASCLSYHWRGAATKELETVLAVMIPEQAGLVRTGGVEREESGRRSIRAGVKLCLIKDSADEEGFLGLAQSILG